MEDFRVPDIVGELVGWKRLDVIRTGRVVRLKSSYGSTIDLIDAVWPTNRWYEAACPRGTCEEPPGVGCSCGIYSANTLEQLLDSSYPTWSQAANAPVIVEIGLVGKVLPGTLGFRAARARIRKVIVPLSKSELGAELARTYACEWELSLHWARQRAS